MHMTEGSTRAIIVVLHTQRPQSSQKADLAEIYEHLNYSDSRVTSKSAERLLSQNDRYARVDAKAIRPGAGTCGGGDSSRRRGSGATVAGWWEISALAHRSSAANRAAAAADAHVARAEREAQRTAQADLEMDRHKVAASTTPRARRTASGEANRERLHRI